jgi:hypothetical protein
MVNSVRNARGLQTDCPVLHKPILARMRAYTTAIAIVTVLIVTIRKNHAAGYDDKYCRSQQPDCPTSIHSIHYCPDSAVCKLLSCCRTTRKFRISTSRGAWNGVLLNHRSGHGCHSDLHCACSHSLRAAFDRPLSGGLHRPDSSCLSPLGYIEPIMRQYAPQQFYSSHENTYRFWNFIWIKKEADSSVLRQPLLKKRKESEDFHLI